VVKNHLHQASVSTRPLIKDTEGDFSGRCRKRVGIRDLDKIHRTLPEFQTENDDEEVLQDEDGLAILDEQTAGYIYDNLR